ncbi:hypothetical protein T310_2265 [Rasamsonia emersonii CBS 393.64]|uniref:Uncharacterized protein n=1 Tax=Rasamsonia emersonii (strain ATCC 16479 / CBS 393.64 / IMI 116815) TaxID=1408163 RepID=A0A0F4Z054_RASE3|nr:hypothetical protein T310_2265 [Rasamsonia emersonii CBS 393.64]KKA23725.1 hypothetical protein T310_2265 [Rasamsonia emersonii CBS 393.64]
MSKRKGERDKEEAYKKESDQPYRAAEPAHRGAIWGRARDRGSPDDNMISSPVHNDMDVIILPPLLGPDRPGGERKTIGGRAPPQTNAAAVKSTDWFGHARPSPSLGIGQPCAAEQAQSG